MNKDNFKYKCDDGMDSVAMAIIQMAFEDIKGCARMYTYYLVAGRERETYRMNDTTYYSKEKMLYAMSEHLKTVIDEDMTTLVKGCLDDPDYFIKEYFNRLNRLYPEFCDHFKVRINEIKNVYREL